MITRRTVIKWLHWLSFFIILWFFFVEPEDVSRLGSAALALHAGMGTILAILTSIWFTMFLRKGLVGRAGPKLPKWARLIYPTAHRILHFATPIMVLSGALTGFAAPFVIHAFGILPINPGFGSNSIQEILGDFHETTFNILIPVIALHAVFHIWRHFGLRDNALRIMMPKVVHRWL